MAEHVKIGTHSLQKGADGWKLPKQKNLEKNKKTKNKFQRVLAGTPPSKESRNIVFFCFSKVFTKCGVLQGNCQSALGNAVKHLKISS